ncbi:MAG: hypothetical protein V4647_02970 [Pseudomonadota bacterium]
MKLIFFIIQCALLFGCMAQTQTNSLASSSAQPARAAPPAGDPNAAINVGSMIKTIIDACPGKQDEIGWQIVGERLVELSVGLLVEGSRIDCVTHGLQQEGIRFVFADGRKV